MTRTYSTMLPKGKLFEVDLVYNNINNPILLIRAIDEEQAKRYLSKTYANKKLHIISFKKIGSSKKANPRAIDVDVRNEKYWNPDTTQILKLIEI